MNYFRPITLIVVIGYFILLCIISTRCADEQIHNMVAPRKVSE